MRRLAMTVAALALSAGVAWADTIENLYGNTLLVTYPSGAVERFFINEDGTMEVEIGGQLLGAMPWTRDGDQFCVAPEGTPPQCSDFPADKAVGDSWEVTRPDGRTAHYSIVAGR